MELTELERAVLETIAHQVPEAGAALAAQIASATVARRDNSGVGFYTTFHVDPETPRADLRSPCGDAGAQVVGFQNGMGFLLWLKDGHADKLEAYTYDDSTSDLDLLNLKFTWVGPRAKAPRNEPT